MDDLTHVINYGLPEDVAVYTHRSGRTGRANKTGVSVAIIHSREKNKIRQIEKIIGKEFEYRKVPTPEHIIEKQLYNLADRLERVEVDENEIAKYLPGVSKKLEWLSESDLLKRVLSLEFNRLLAYYKDMPNIDLDEADKPKKERGGKGRDKDRRDARDGYERLVVNIGKGSGFFPGNLMDLINRNSVGQKPVIGRIDLMPGYTLFDVRKCDAHRVLSALKHTEFFGQKVVCERADNRDYAAETADYVRGRKKGKGAKRKDKGLNTDYFLDSDQALNPGKPKKKKTAKADKDRNPR